MPNLEAQWLCLISVFIGHCPASCHQANDAVLIVQQVMYSSSVDIRPEWTVKEQIPFTSLMKLNSKVEEPQTLHFCGKLQYYEKSYDRVTPRTEKPLQRTRKVFKSVTTSDDPIIR